jgi:hypothetical protein
MDAGGLEGRGNQDRELREIMMNDGTTANAFSRAANGEKRAKSAVASCNLNR